MKAQENLVGFLLIVMISLVVVAATYFWASPLIEKVKNQDEVLRLENRMLELHSAIKKVANEQSQLSADFPISKGSLGLYANNTLSFSENLLLPSAYYGRILIGNETSNVTNDVGILGLDEPATLLESESIRFDLHYIYLNDTRTGDCYGIKLVSGGQTAIGPGEHKIFLKWANQNNATVEGCKNVTVQEVAVSMI